MKKKKKHKQITLKKKKVGTVATVPFGTVAILKNIVLTSVTTFSQNIYFQLWLVTVSYFIILNISTYKKLTPQ